MKPKTENKKQTALNCETQYLELEGCTLAYRSIGEGSPILLINRFRGTLDTWDPLFLDTLAQEHQVVFFDYTGIGYSTGILPTDITLVAKDAKDVAKALKPKDTAVLGWSFGGLVAQVAAFSYPDLFKQAILVGTGPSEKREVPLEQAFLDRALKPINKFAGFFIYSFLNIIFKSG